MPRKKKRRDSAGRKEPLTFVESPLNIPHGIGSPVLAVDSPCTADVVPIDDITKRWVSPQFHEPPCPRRVTRSRRKHTSSPAKLKPKKLDNLVPLQFLGDKSPVPVPETHHEPHYELRKDKVQRPNTKRTLDTGKRTRKSGRVSVSSPSDIQDNDVDEVTPVRISKRITEGSRRRSKVKTELPQGVFGIEATGAFKRLQEHEANMLDEDELPDDFTAIKSTRKRKGKQNKTGIRTLNLSDVDLELTLPEQAAASNTMLDTASNTATNTASNTASNSASNTASNIASPVFGTQHLPGDAKGKRKRRLFSAADSKQPSGISPGYTANNDTMDALPDMSGELCLPEVDTPNIRDVVRHLQPPLSARCPNIPSQSPSPSPSPSLKHTPHAGRRVMRLKCLVRNTPVRTKTPVKVLAYDTPETEYGLPVRQRRLKHWKLE